VQNHDDVLCHKYQAVIGSPIEAKQTTVEWLSLSLISTAHCNCGDTRYIRASMEYMATPCICMATSLYRKQYYSHRTYDRTRSSGIGTDISYRARIHPSVTIPFENQTFYVTAYFMLRFRSSTDHNQQLGCFS
jgi:hypothetical protein